MSGRLGKDFGASLGRPGIILPVIVLVIVVAFLFWFIGRG